ncbi:hypothetical protein NEOLI_005338 [Neolecta irregularis DAH-3]|uniref:Uncharacterized protein n=1 Tax=Neolecta irregularis (strain DAH-3) TaxID=1198029 RepID=A0A1U7LIV9_NEOID|nr:hypothetical protein NEOLI_005338 [Neolecta irregularis DAH-3]|eukprot:OLL22587.1 hypothetical protein NEOLI_005338 [Neolecta irregularis DAH-3]
MTRSGSSSPDEGEIIEHDSFAHKRLIHDDNHRPQKRRRKSTRDRRQHRVVYEPRMNDKHGKIHSNVSIKDPLSNVTKSANPDLKAENPDLKGNPDKPDMNPHSMPDLNPHLMQASKENPNVITSQNPDLKADMTLNSDITDPKDLDLDEDALIEKRRLRREAILAKYKSLSSVPASPKLDPFTG